MPNLRPVSMFLPGQGGQPTRSLSSPTQSVDITSPRSTADSSVSLKSELADLESPDVVKDKKGKIHRVSTCDKEQLTDSVEVKECSTGMSQYIEKSLTYNLEVIIICRTSVFMNYIPIQ